MLKININLRNVVAIAICLATVMFASCDETDPEDEPNTTGKEQGADIATFTFDGIDGQSAINKNARTVTAKAKETVDLTALVVEFTLSKGASAFVNGVRQESKKTVNNFSKPVVYNVESGDGETERDWTVTITGGKPAEVSIVDDVPLFNVMEDVRDIINYMAPGIYIFDDNQLFAKGNDGSWFNVPNLNAKGQIDFNVPPAFWPHAVTMSDGDKREAFINSTILDELHPQTSAIYYTRVMNLYPTSDEMYQGGTRTWDFAFAAMYKPLFLNGSLQLKMYRETEGAWGKWEKITGETICGVSTTLYRHTMQLTGDTHEFHISQGNICLKYHWKTPYGEGGFTAKHVDLQAGDMNYMLLKIAGIIGERCPSTIVDFDDMLREDYYVGDRWMSEWYPASFETEYFPKYTGSVKIGYFNVNRSYHKVLQPLDYIGSMKFEGTNAKYDDVVAYIQKLKQLNPDIVDNPGAIIDAKQDFILWDGLIDNCGTPDPHPLGSETRNYQWKVGFVEGWLRIEFWVIRIFHL
jgi:hypothetical protein